MLDYFQEIFEGTVAADIAQAPTPNGRGLQKRKRKGEDDENCPCKKDPMSEECQNKRLALDKE